MVVPVEGKIYWTITHVAETQNYICGAYPPRTPWNGKLFSGSREGSWMLYSFNRDTGEIDHDPNAYAYLTNKDLFETFEEAKEAFLVKAREYLETISKFQKEYEEFLQKYMQNPNNMFIEPPQL